MSHLAHLDSYSDDAFLGAQSRSDLNLNQSPTLSESLFLSLPNPSSRDAALRLRFRSEEDFVAGENWRLRETGPSNRQGRQTMLLFLFVPLRQNPLLIGPVVALFAACVHHTKRRNSKCCCLCCACLITRGREMTGRFCDPSTPTAGRADATF